MSSRSLVRPLAIFGIGLLVLVVGVGAWLLTGTENRGAGVSGETRSSGAALIGGPFTLLDQDGQARTEADFAGRHMLIYFGYTYCPDFCPTTLNVMTQALDKLAETAPDAVEQVVPVFITIDPERDTVEAMKAYVTHFHSNFVGLTGSEEQVAAAAKAYRIFYQKVEDESAGEYLMDHSTFTYLMGPDGGYSTHFAHNTTPEAMAEKIAELIGG